MASPDYSALERGQVTRLAEVRGRRDAPAARGALDALSNGAAEYAHADAERRTGLLPLIVNAVRARASVGEISDVLRARWGAYKPGG